jgi:hypothetical protein
MKDANKIIKSKKLPDNEKIVKLVEKSFSEDKARELLKADAG